MHLEGPRKEDIACGQEYTLDGTQGVSFTIKDKACGYDFDITRRRVLFGTGLWSPEKWQVQTSRLLLMALTDPKWVRAYVPEPDLGQD